MFPTGIYSIYVSVTLKLNGVLKNDCCSINIKQLIELSEEAIFPINGQHIKCCFSKYY